MNKTKMMKNLVAMLISNSKNINHHLNGKTHKKKKKINLNLTRLPSFHTRTNFITITYYLQMPLIIKQKRNSEELSRKGKKINRTKDSKQCRLGKLLKIQTLSLVNGITITTQKNSNHPCSLSLINTKDLHHSLKKQNKV